MDEDLNTVEGTARADFLRGSWQDDLILAGAGNDLIFARSGNDIVDAGDGNDSVFAGAGDDLVKTGLGRDFADGGRGIDTAQFDGNSSDYRITSFFGLTFVIDLRNGETDTLTRFELLKFDDGLFDINGSPVASDPEAVDDEATTREDTVISIDVLANDSDPNNDPLTVLEATAANGQVVIETDGTLTYTPDENFSGEDTINYTISDGNGGTSSAVVTVLVGGVADQPRLFAPQSVEARDPADIELTQLVAALVDKDGSEKLTVRFSNLPQGAVILNPAAIAEKDGQIADLGSLLDALGADIGQLKEDIDEVSKQIEELEQGNPGSEDLPPLQEQRANLQKQLAEKTDARSKAQADLDQAKFDKEKLTQEADANGEIEFHDLGSGFVLRLPEGSTEDFLLGVQAFATESDPVLDEADRVAENRATIEIIVGEAPEANDDTAETAEDTPVTIKVLDNDTDSDGDTLKITEVTDGAIGKAVINPDGTVTYTPNKNASGEDKFTYTIEDGNGGTSTATVKVLVGGVADAPSLAAPDTLQTLDRADIDLSGIVAGLADTDGSETLSIKFTGLPVGTVILNPTEVELREKQIANLTFTIEALEPEITQIQEGIRAAEERIAVIKETDPDSDEIRALEDEKAALEQRLAVKVADKAQAEADLAETEFALSKVKQEAGPDGMVEFDAPLTGLLLRLPETTIDDFTLGVEATATESEPLASPADRTATTFASVNIIVGESPTAEDDTATTAEDTPVTIKVLGNDQDTDGDVLSVVDVIGVSNGFTVVNDDGSITFTPDPNFSGETEFSYTITDGKGGVSGATVKVLVGGVADDPTLELPDALSTIDLAPIALDDVNASLNDLDGSESLSVKFRGLPNGAVIAKAVILEKADQIKVLNEEISELERLIEEVMTELETINQALEATDENTPQDELDDLLFRKEQGESILRQASDDKNMKEAERNQLAAEVRDLTNDTDPDGNIEIDGFGDGYILLLPKGTVDNLQIKVDAIATESEPLAGPEFETATVSRSLQINVLELLAPQDDFATTIEDVPVTIFATANDVGDDPEILEVGVPANGTAVIDDNGDLLYTPNANFSGVDTFNYLVTDAFGIAETATVEVTVGGVADTPNLALPDGLLTTDLAPIPLDGIQASLVDTDDSENLKVKFGGLPEGSIISNPSRLGAFSGRLEVVKADIARNEALTAETEKSLAETIAAIEELSNITDPTEDQLNELATLEQGREALQGELQALSDQRAEFVARRDELRAIAQDLSQTADKDGHIEIKGFGPGFILQLPDGVIDDFKLTVEAIATESDPLASPDAQTASALGEVQVGVRESPQAVDDAITVREDVPEEFNVVANDVDSDGDGLPIVEVTDGANGTTEDIGGGNIRYTPNANFSGDDQFTYTIEDPDGNTSTATVRVTVGGVGDQPNFSAIPESLQTLDLADIDLGGIVAELQDTDGSESLLIKLGQLPPGSIVTNPTAIAALEDRRGEQEADIKVLEGRVRDNERALAGKKDDLQDLEADPNATEEQREIVRSEIELLEQSIAGDQAEIASTTASLAGAIQQIATLTKAADADGMVSFEAPTDGWVLQLPVGTTENFVLSVEAIAVEADPVASEAERSAVSERVTVGVEVLESTPNEDPIAVDDFVEADSGVAVNIDVLANDFDLDQGDQLSVDSVSRAPINGQAIVNVDGTIDYEPFAGFVGTDSFEYTITDGNGGEATATVTVQVEPVNSEPEGAPVVTGTPQVGETLTANVDGISDADEIITPFSYQWEVLTGDDPDNLSSWDPIAGASQQSFTPDSDLAGQTLRVRVFYTDAGNTFETVVSAPIELVEPANQDPIALDDGGTLSRGLGLILDVLANDTDPENDPLTILSVTDPGNGTAALGSLPGGGQAVTYNPDAGFVGIDTFDYTITDGNGGTATATVTVNVLQGQVIEPPGGGDDPIDPPIFIEPPDDGGGGGVKPPPGGGGGGVIIVPTPIFPTPIQARADGSVLPFDGVLTGTSDSDVFVFSQGDGAINVLGFQQASGAAGEVADQIQLDGFGLAFADLDSNGDGQVGAGDAGVSAGGVASLAVDFGGGDVLSVNGVSFLTEDDLLFV